MAVRDGNKTTISKAGVKPEDTNDKSDTSKLRIGRYFAASYQHFLIIG